MSHQHRNIHHTANLSCLPPALMELLVPLPQNTGLGTTMRLPQRTNYGSLIRYFVICMWVYLLFRGTSHFFFTLNQKGIDKELKPFSLPVFWLYFFPYLIAIRTHLDTFIEIIFFFVLFIYVIIISYLFMESHCFSCHQSISEANMFKDIYIISISTWERFDICKQASKQIHIWYLKENSTYFLWSTIVFCFLIPILIISF